MMTSSPWTNITAVPEPAKLQDIMLEEAQQKLQEKNKNLASINVLNNFEKCNISENTRVTLDGANNLLESDELLARQLQRQFDKENVHKCIKYTVNTKVELPITVLSDSDNKGVQNLDVESESEEWDQYETVKEAITKYDMMPAFHSSGIQKKINSDNSPHHSLKLDGNLNEVITRKLDENSRLQLDKLIKERILKNVNCVLSTEKEYAILHADYYSKSGQSRECLLKVLFTSPAEKKFYKKNMKLKVKKEIKMFLQMNKEKVLCPKIIASKNNILLLSVIDIGKCWIHTRTLQEAVLTSDEYYTAYNQIFWEIHRIYYAYRITYINWSASNILWYNDKSYFINGYEVVKMKNMDFFTALLKVCTDFYNFFHNKVPAPRQWSPEDMFCSITFYKYKDKRGLEVILQRTLLKEQMVDYAIQ